MKPPPFAYDDPASADEALALLGEHGDEAKVLAGGQSLVPLLNFRLARPDRLIDLNGVREFDYIRVEGPTLRIGCMTRQAILERSDVVVGKVPLLAQAVRYVGHPQIRNRGTVGGSVAHADPAAELPAALTALAARFHLSSVETQRVVEPEEFFVTHLTSSLEPHELLTEIEVPIPAPGTGSAFVEIARRDGDFALAGAAAIVALGDDGMCSTAALALLAAAGVPIRAREAEAWLRGQQIDERTAAEAARRAVQGASPIGNNHGSSGYRVRVLEVVARRALLEANERAREAT